MLNKLFLKTGCLASHKEKAKSRLLRQCVRVTHTAHPLPMPTIRTVITVFTPYYSSRNFIFLRCVYVLLRSRYGLLHLMRWLVFVVETGVCWDLEITFMCVIYRNLSPGFLPVLQFSPVSIIPPLLHTHPSTTHAICFSLNTSVFPCQYRSTIAPHSSIYLPPTLYNVFLPVLQFSPVSTIPPLLHTHPSIYHPHCIMFFSQHFSFPLSVSFHHCSTLIHPSTTHAV